MGIYESQVLPRLIDRLLSSTDMSTLRRRTCDRLSGTILEIGFGSGLNVPHLPDAVDKVLAVDPSQVARRLSGPRIERRRIEVEFVGLDGSRIDLPDSSVDHALSTMTLCTIPDVESALCEIHRVLKPGGSFAFLEHGISPDPVVARWQRRLTPLQKRLFGGCHLDRSATDIVVAGGLRLVDSVSSVERGPRIVSFFTGGVAIKP